MSGVPGGLARVLIRIPNWLGDAILARPLLHGLRASHPGATRWGVGPAGLVALLRDDGALDEADAWPRAAGARGDLARRLREWRPQAALVLPGSFSSALLAWRSRAPVRVGYRGEARTPLLSHALPRRDRGELHLAREFLELGRVIGVAAAPVPPLRIAAAAREAARELLDAAGVGGEERLALIGPRSAFGPAREWPGERFGRVGRELSARGFRVLVCGAPAERERCAAVAAAAGPAAVDLSGRTDLPALAALCARAALALCNDSGLAHLAAAAGTPTIQIYGSASSAWTAAQGPHVRILQHPPVCSPCYQRTCRIGYRCLWAVEEDEVLRACQEVVA